MHDNVTRPKGNMVVLVTPNPRWKPIVREAGGRWGGGNSKSTGSMIYLKAQTNRLSRSLKGAAWRNDMFELLLLGDFESANEYFLCLN